MTTAVLSTPAATTNNRRFSDRLREAFIRTSRASRFDMTPYEGIADLFEQEGLSGRAELARAEYRLLTARIDNEVEFGRLQRKVDNLKAEFLNDIGGLSVAAGSSKCGVYWRLRLNTATLITQRDKVLNELPSVRRLELVVTGRDDLRAIMSDPRYLENVRFLGLDFGSFASSMSALYSGRAVPMPNIEALWLRWYDAPTTAVLCDLLACTALFPGCKTIVIEQMYTSVYRSDMIGYAVGSSMARAVKNLRIDYPFKLADYDQIASMLISYPNMWNYLSLGFRGAEVGDSVIGSLAGITAKLEALRVEGVVIGEPAFTSLMTSPYMRPKHISIDGLAFRPAGFFKNKRISHVRTLCLQGGTIDNDTIVAIADNGSLAEATALSLNGSFDVEPLPRLLNSDQLKNIGVIGLRSDKLKSVADIETVKDLCKTHLPSLSSMSIGTTSIDDGYPYRESDDPDLTNGRRGDVWYPCVAANYGLGD